MNFHKTIGFLASLLLVLGLGVPDSFAQDDPTLTLSLNRTRVSEGSSVNVTVTLNPAIPDGETASVTLNLGLSPTGYTATENPNADPVVTVTTIDVMVTGSSNDTESSSGSNTVYIVNNDMYHGDGTLTVGFGGLAETADQTFSFTNTAGTTTDYTFAIANRQMIPIRDNDDALGTITLSGSSPASMTLNGSTTATVTVKITLAEPNTPIPTEAVTVAVSGTNVDGTEITSVEATVTGFSKDLNFDPNTVSATATGTVEVTIAVDTEGRFTLRGTAVDYEPGEREMAVIDRDAQDVAGYRVVIATPSAAGAWVGVGNDKIKVDIIRIGNVAYPWTAFTSIKVAVRDTSFRSSDNADVVSHEIDQVTATNISPTTANADITHTGSLGDVLWRGNDTVRFEIRINAPDATNDPADLPANGQYTGVYAEATFSFGANTVLLTNLQDDKPVYPADPTLVEEANRYVGDGKLVKVDNVIPLVDAISAVQVSSGDESDAAIQATVGDEIRVAVKVSENTIFRDTGLRIQLQTVDGTGDLNGHDFTAPQINVVTKNKDFSASEIIAAGSDSLIHSWEVTEGFFTIPLTLFVAGIGPDNSKHSINNQQARVRAIIKDQAGNFSAGTWITFDVDSRSPGVSILYPTADSESAFARTHSMHFTGASESADADEEKHLNPLRILVDEELNSLMVFAAGSDTLDLSAQLDPTGAGDSTQVYSTTGLNSPNKDADGNFKGTGQAGTEIELVVLAEDLLGNVTKTSISGAIHDEKVPTIAGEDFFPTRALLADDNYTINNATRHPVFTLQEAVDSLAIIYIPSTGDDIVENGGALAKGTHQVLITEAFEDGRTYSLSIFARDLAGNSFETAGTLANNLAFDGAFQNPIANSYTVTYAETDSVIAGQLNDLTIQGVDASGDDDDDDRLALTYKNAAMISAWDMASGGQSSSVRFHGEGVTDNGDGSAMLDAAAWKLGARTVQVSSETAIDLTKILVQNLEDGQDGTSVATFEGAVDSFYVGVADFAGFEITAHEPDVDGMDVSDRGITGNFDLKVVPVDRYGNPSVRAYMGVAAGKLAEDNDADDDDANDAVADSLSILDTRVGDEGIEYNNGIDVTFVSIPTIEDLNPLFVIPVPLEGLVVPIVLPEGRRSLTVQARVDNDNLNEDDMRSLDVRTTKQFRVVTALNPMLTLWVPGMEGDQAGNDVEIKAGESVTVTVAAEGYEAGSMVTFTKNGTMMDPVAADDDGVAKLMIMMSAAGSVTVSATDGNWPSDELSITFVVQAGRMSYVDANGDPVYLISSENMTVDVADFLAFVASLGESEDDANYNPQADVNDDGTVDVADFLIFISSFGKTATGPATKPLVLAPGVNENAEFALSLGSERVVAGELVAVDVSLANVEAVMGYGFTLNYDAAKFEFISVAQADEDLLASTGAETLFHHVAGSGQVEVATGLYNGTAVSGGGDIVRFVFRVLYEFEDNARFEIADGLVFDPSQLSNPAVVAGVLELQSTPREFALHQNFPNPFNPDTTIKYDLAESADVTLQIYNVLGQVVRTLVASEAQNAGRYQIRWNGMDERGVPVSSGIYFYQIAADGKFSDVRKLMLLK